MIKFVLSKNGIVLVGFLGVVGYFLWAEHRAHLISILPWLLLAACPLLHVFMHGGHGSHGAQPDEGSSRGLNNTDRKE
ncbi:MAG: DUF2933 domain-containing protein [Rhizobiales bacterium]|nr:DUF2933 domain-containing protein [Hyphomicrobiales bacterium]